MIKVFNEYKAENFLKKYLPIANHLLIKNREELKKIKFKFPLVLKIISDQALHKTEIKGIEIVKRKEDLENSFNVLLSRSKKKKLKIEGILVQEFLKGLELIIGIKKDPIFNHIILFGLGGIFTEVLKDVCIRKCPIISSDAEEMIKEIKSKDILFGARNKKFNINLLKKILVSVSTIPEKYPKILELDINPLIISEKNAKVVDARIITE